MSTCSFCGHSEHQHTGRRCSGREGACFCDGFLRPYDEEAPLTDSEMMDWLERYPESIRYNRRNGTYSLWAIRNPPSISSIRWFQVNVVDFDTLREAVTAASKLLGD